MCIACEKKLTRETMCLAESRGARPGCLKERDHIGEHENVYGYRWENHMNAKPSLFSNFNEPAQELLNEIRRDEHVSN